MKKQIQLIIMLTALSGIAGAIDQKPKQTPLHKVAREDSDEFEDRKPKPTPLHKVAREDRYDLTAIQARFKESEGKFDEYLQTKNEEGRTPLEEARYYTAIDKKLGRIDTSHITSFGEWYLEELHKNRKNAMTEQYLALRDNKQVSHLIREYAQAEALAKLKQSLEADSRKRAQWAEKRKETTKSSNCENKKSTSFFNEDEDEEEY